MRLIITRVPCVYKSPCGWCYFRPLSSVWLLWGLEALFQLVSAVLNACTFLSVFKMVGDGDDTYTDPLLSTLRPSRPRHTASICTELQGQVFQCYRDNPQQTLVCSSLARQYTNCIQQAKQVGKRGCTHQERQSMCVCVCLCVCVCVLFKYTIIDSWYPVGKSLP